MKCCTDISLRLVPTIIVQSVDCICATDSIMSLSHLPLAVHAIPTPTKTARKLPKNRFELIS